MVEGSGVSEGKGGIDLVGRYRNMDELDRIWKQGVEAEEIECRKAIDRELGYSPGLAPST